MLKHIKQLFGHRIMHHMLKKLASHSDFNGSTLKVKQDE